MNKLSHFSVLLNETIEMLEVKEDGIYLDCTLGGGGHSEAILKKLKNGHLHCIDQDSLAIKIAKERLEKIGSNFTIHQDNFENIDFLFPDGSFDGIVYDLGVSSFQFDLPERGFSYRFDAPLDMRMNEEAVLCAKDVVNDYSKEELTRIFFEYGEEPFAKQIARKIVEKREVKKIETTFELVEIIKSALPQKVLRKSGHPAKQVFQALRIEVNRELECLEKSLEKALNLLKVGGIICVITFHSLEDRIVKRIFKKHTTLLLPKGIPFIPEGYEVKFNLKNAKVILATKEELDLNNRSHSAKLRAIQKIK